MTSKTTLWLGVPLALLLTRCNLVLGIESATERSTSGGAGGQGGGESTTGGSAVGGAGGCPGEESAGIGVELAVNGSFEQGLLGWANFGVAALETNTTERFCGCASGEVLVPDAYSEIRSRLGAITTPGLVHARARIRAGDAVPVQLALRVDDVNAEPPRDFAFDASDSEGADGWRLAEGTWDVTTSSDSVYAILVFDGMNTPADTKVVIDCVSYVAAP